MIVLGLKILEQLGATVMRIADPVTFRGPMTPEFLAQVQAAMKVSYPSSVVRIQRLVKYDVDEYMVPVITEDVYYVVKFGDMKSFTSSSPTSVTTASTALKRPTSKAAKKVKPPKLAKMSKLRCMGHEAGVKNADIMGKPELQNALCALGVSIYV